jgi:nitrogen fixation NifU-like protein
MTELDELYQDLILDHGRRPRNFAAPADANQRAEGYNPLCGDHFTVSLTVRDGAILDAGFSGSGCAISTASASLMTEAIRGLSVADAQALSRRLQGFVTGLDDPGVPPLGKLEAFAGVRNFPSRVKCATLAWHTLRAALGSDGRIVSTE